MIFKFSSITAASMAYQAFLRAGISARLEKGTAGGCAYRITVAEADRPRALAVLRTHAIAFS